MITHQDKVWDQRGLARIVDASAVAEPTRKTIRELIPHLDRCNGFSILKQSDEPILAYGGFEPVSAGYDTAIADQMYRWNYKRLLTEDHLAGAQVVVLDHINDRVEVAILISDDSNTYLLLAWWLEPAGPCRSKWVQELVAYLGRATGLKALICDYDYIPEAMAA